MSLSSHIIEETPVETIFKKEESFSSEEPSIPEWMVLAETPPGSPKVALFNQGLYDPGSGEVCAAYLQLSDSEVLRHLYYNYPGLTNPGIEDALLKPEPKKTYSVDGQELYLDLCKQMNVMPLRSFHRGLLKDVIDLRYYGVNAVGVRAMCLALSYNKHVKRLDLTANHLTLDACYHLGRLLGESFALQELILSGCRIRAEGLRRIVDLLSERSMDLLDLSKNDLGDVGFQHLADQITRGAVIKRLNLSYNDLTSESALALAVVMKGNDTITHLDISWNKMYAPKPKGSNELLRMIGNSGALVELNMAWNNLKTGTVFRELLGAKNLKVLDFSNNRLSTEAVEAISTRLRGAKQLHSLDLSYNPLTPDDALMLLCAMRAKNVKLKNLLMEEVAVSKDFVKERKAILGLIHRSNTTITHGRVMHNYTLSIRDLRDIVMKRLDYLTRCTKKCKMNIGLYFMQEHKARPYLQTRELLGALKNASAPSDDALIEELANSFPGPKTDNGRTINLAGVVEYVHRLWPELKLPPTPPEPVEPPEEKRQAEKKNK